VIQYREEKRGERKRTRLAFSGDREKGGHRNMGEETWTGGTRFNSRYKISRRGKKRDAMFRWKAGEKRLLPRSGEKGEAMIKGKGAPV